MKTKIDYTLPIKDEEPQPISREKRLLWLDDYRDPFNQEIDWLRFSPIGKDVNINWVKNYDEFVIWITLNGLPDAICFDHDLGFKIDPNAEFKTYKGEISCYSLSPWNDDEKTGYDCAKWLINYCIKNNRKLPKYEIQSSNPIGKENIDKLLKNYNKHCKMER